MKGGTRVLTTPCSAMDAQAKMPVAGVFGGCTPVGFGVWIVPFSSVWSYRNVIRPSTAIKLTTALDLNLGGQVPRLLVRAGKI